MIKKLIICLVVLFTLCIARGAYIVYETNDWEKYVTKENNYDTLVYTYRAKNYNDLYEMVVINEALDDSLYEELYDFAHYYHELKLAHKNYLANKDYSLNIKNMESYLKKISTKDLLLSIEELNEIYKIKDQ